MPRARLLDGYRKKREGGGDVVDRGESRSRGALPEASGSEREADTQLPGNVRSTTHVFNTVGVEIAREGE